MTASETSASSSVSSSAPSDANHISAPANLIPAPVAIAPAPSTTRADVPTPSPSATTAAQSADRTVVLFPPGTTFIDEADFFARCAKASCEKFGVSTIVRNRDKPSIVACCTRRQTEVRCSYAVRAVPQATGWVLQFDKCSWTHTHDPGKQKAT
ncbi:hypothetical protein NBRC10512_005653 [Rhodotorula toruloides]